MAKIKNIPALIEIYDFAFDKRNQATARADEMWEHKWAVLMKDCIAQKAKIELDNRNAQINQKYLSEMYQIEIVDSKAIE
jgi:hypothetical protein